jgi:toxin-antitoxin system PIN domain toxin
VTYLLDINVLVALFDSAHVHHEPAHRWFEKIGQLSWATCPITQNGFVRVVSNPAYPTVVATPAEATDHLRILCTRQEHVFWPDIVTFTDASLFDLSQLRGHQQITDMYLAGLALRHDGMLATFDTRIPVGALVGVARSVVEVIPSA